MKAAYFSQSVPAKWEYCCTCEDQTRLKQAFLSHPEVSKPVRFDNGSDTVL